MKLFLFDVRVENFGANDESVLAIKKLLHGFVIIMQSHKNMLFTFTKATIRPTEG